MHSFFCWRVYNTGLWSYRELGACVIHKIYRLQPSCPLLLGLPGYWLRKSVQTYAVPKHTFAREPSKKIMDAHNVKRDLQVTPLARDGFLVVCHEEPLSAVHECIILPLQVLDDVLHPLHLRLNHPTKHQMNAVVHRCFYALDMEKGIDRVCTTCQLCASLCTVPGHMIEQSSSDPPESVGVNLPTDALKHSQQLILAVQESIISIAIAVLVPDEKNISLRDAFLTVCIDLRPIAGHPTVIRTDPAPGFNAIQIDSLLWAHNISLEIDRVEEPKHESHC